MGIFVGFLSAKAEREQNATPEMFLPTVMPMYY
jgi:hypothetical protein